MTHHLTKFEQTQTPITLHITALTHDGRGIATYDDTHGDKSGKKVFISHALPTETVTVHLTKSKKSYDEADCSGVLTPSPHRTAPICPHFGVCGGCTLQHFDVDEQIRHTVCPTKPPYQIRHYPCHVATANRGRQNALSHQSSSGRALSTQDRQAHCGLS